MNTIIKNNMSILNLKTYKKSNQINIFYKISLSPLFIIIFFILTTHASVHAQSLARETLGGVSVNSSFAQVLKGLGKASSISKEIYDAHYECWAKVYFYDEAGIEVEVCRVGRNFNIRSVRSVNSKIARTTRGQGVGSDSNSIFMAYANAKSIGDDIIEVEDKVRGIVLRFLLQGKKVYEVNLFKDQTITARNRLRRDLVLQRRYGV